MLSEKQINEIKEHLEKAQNPLFYYDNDCDGLCSFLLLRKYLGRGKGVAVRSFPDLNARYAKKAKELNADYVFILDKPLISKGFVEEISSYSLPLVWIDHHKNSMSFWDTAEKQQKELTPAHGINSAASLLHHNIQINLEDFSNVLIYNPALEKLETTEPVTYLIYQITKRKEDIWLAVIGCIADHFLPDFAQEFAEKFPELWGPVKAPFDAYYKTEIGKIAQALNFGLKDKTSNIVALQNFLISCKTPADVFQELSTNYAFRKRYSEIKKKYTSLLEKAKSSLSDNLLFFSYSGSLSISSDLSNELSYLYPDKFIAVAYKKGAIVNISLRGRRVRLLLEKVIQQLQNGSGGGHEDAVGARINSSELNKFKNLLSEEINNERNKN